MRLGCRTCRPACLGLTPSTSAQPARPGSWASSAARTATSSIRYVGDPCSPDRQGLRLHDPERSDPPMSWSPRLQRSFDGAHLRTLTLGHPVIDEYLAFAGA